MSAHTNPLQLFISLIIREKKEVGIIILYGIGVGIMSLTVPIGVQNIVNMVMLGSVTQPLVFLLFVVFIGLTIGAILRSLQVKIIEIFQRRFLTEMALELAYRIPRLRSEAACKHQLPEQVNRFFDVFTVQKSTSMLLLEGLGLLLQVSVGLLLLAAYHWFLLTYSIVLVFLIIVVFFVIGRGAVKTSIGESSQKYRVVAWLEEIAYKNMVFRSATTRESALKRADAVVCDYLTARDNHFKILFRQIVSLLSIQVVASTVLLGIGAWLVINGQLSLGQLVAAEIVVTGALGSLDKFQKHLESYYDLLAGLQKLSNLVSLPAERAQGLPVENTEQGFSVELNDVGYGMRRGSFVFQIDKLKVESGAKVVITGENGTGKSVLLDLIFGSKEAARGVIKINDIDQRDMLLESFREEVALIRDQEVLPGTIFQNLCLDRDDITAAEARHALEQVGLLEEVLLLEEGLWTQLSSSAVPLTNSQAHVLMLARAIITKPRLILVDESLDNLDEKVRTKVLGTLLDQNAPWTLVVTSQDNDIVKAFPRVITLDKTVAKGAS